MVTGPPRVAPFFADLDPTTGTGKIFVNAAADQFTVTYCNVRGFDSTRTVTAQATLLPGRQRRDEVRRLHQHRRVHRRDLARADDRHRARRPHDRQRRPAPARSSSASRRRARIDTFAVAKKFYATHPDNFDQILLWTDQPLIRDAFAYELNIKNEVRGIGQDIFDISRLTGSGGRLRSLVVMDWLGKYPEDPATEVPRREQHAERARAGGRPPLAGLRVVPRSHRRAFERAARTRRRALELLLRLRRVGDGGERHRGSRRRPVQDHRRGQALQPARSIHDGRDPAEQRADVLLRREPGLDRRSAATRRRSASRSPAPGATCWSTT